MKLFDKHQFNRLFVCPLSLGWMNAFGQFNFANDDFVNVSEDVSVRTNVLHNDDGDETIFDLSSLQNLEYKPDLASRPRYPYDHLYPST